MTDAPLDARAIFDVLIEEGVDFILVGGFAVMAHGVVRATKDVDLVPNPDPANLIRLAGAIERLEGRVRGMDEFDESELPQPDAQGLALGGNWVMDTKHGRFDVMQLVADLEYAHLAPRAVEAHVFGHIVRICSYDDLVAMKEAAGREEDLLDLKRLREARGEG